MLRKGKVRPFLARHPWVLDRAIERVEGQPADGEVVELVSDREQFVARGIFNGQSKIRVRLYTWNQAEMLDADTWRERLETAISLRQSLGYDRPEGGSRLVYSEADGLSGLVVDRFADYLVVQATSLAMASRLDMLVPLLVQMLEPRGVVLRLERDMSRAEGLTLEECVLAGAAPTGPVFIQEHGIRYGVELGAGQKTGFYLDQRENRRVAAGYLAGRKILDLFCYCGAFSLAAQSLAGVHTSLGIDSSQRAITLARANAQLNGHANLHFEEGDCFARLDRLAVDAVKFGGLVLDPPKFARNRTGVPEALRAYHHLNRQAVQVLEPGGILVTCSCSGHVSRDDFLFLLSDVAQRTKRDIQVLEMRGAAPDHPVTPTCLETEYLKCFICRVV